MGMIGGTEVSVGLGIESYAAPGTAVAAALSPLWDTFSLQGVVEKSILKGQRGIRIEGSNSIIRRKYSKGSIAFVPNIKNMPYFLSLAMGSCATATASGESVVYEHTFTMNNSNATPRTATFLVKEGGTQVERYTNVVVDKLAFECSDDYAKVTCDLIGKYPDTSTLSPSFLQETEMAYTNMTVKFGTSLSAAAGNSATKVKMFKFELSNNVQMDEAFNSGSADISAGGLVFGRAQIKGSYSLQFTDTTELAKYKANTTNACLVSLQGGAIGSSETEEILFKFGRLVLTKEPLEFNLDGIVTISQEFEVTYDSTDKEMTAVVTNLIANSTNATYAPA